MEIREGCKVAYIGNEIAGHAIGDDGKVIAADGERFHVAWRTGSRKGQIELMSVLDITPVSDPDAVPESRSASLDDSLEYGSPVLSFSARRVFEESGFRGLVAALEDDGHLSTIAGRVSEMVGSIVSEVRGDAAVVQAAADLDYDEADELVSTLVAALVRGAVGQDEEEL